MLYTKKKIIIISSRSSSSTSSSGSSILGLVNVQREIKLYIYHI